MGGRIIRKAEEIHPPVGVIVPDQVLFQAVRAVALPLQIPLQAAAVVEVARQVLPVLQNGETVQEDNTPFEFTNYSFSVFYNLFDE